jgi:hypothetical protein
MGEEIKAYDWQASRLGPWERYHRDAGSARRVIVCLAPYGGWVWDLWSMLDYPVCLAVGDDSPTAQGAMDDADRVMAGYSALTDDELIAQNGVDAYVHAESLKVVTVSEEKGCVLCRNDIASGTAAAEDGNGWLLCGSCASRNPGAVLD